MKILKKHIVYQDSVLIILNKPPGIPVQPDKTGNDSLQSLLTTELGKPLHLIHRLDRPASGLIVFALDENIVEALSRQFRERKVSKTYWAVVKNKPEQATGTLIHYLRKKQAQNRSFAFDKALHHTKKAELNYRLLASIERYHLLEIDLLTGRHHQIRAQLAAINNPIKGDVKYGFRRSNQNRSIHLHARKLVFQHPVNGETMKLLAELPEGDGVWDAFAAITKGQ